MNRSSRDLYDELLVIRCQRRDLAAWNELVGRWNERLLYYLRRFIRIEQDAESAVQEVWLQVFRGIHSLRQEARLAPWLYTIARRTAMNHFRSDYARREEFLSDAISEDSGDFADEQQQFDNAELVHYGLAQLNPPERELLTLFFLEDLTLGELAELLEIPLGTVKSRLFKARRELQSILEQESQRHVG